MEARELFDHLYDSEPVNNATANAYPLVSGIAKPEYGLTKRELFAAMAMQGMLAYPSEAMKYETIVIDSVIVADALIAQLSKP